MSRSLRDHGLPKTNQPIGIPPQWTRYEPRTGISHHCPHCQAHLARVELPVSNPGIPGGRGTCVYLGCPACAWAGPAVTVSTRKTIEALDQCLNRIASALVKENSLSREQLHQLLTEQLDPDHAGLLSTIETLKVFDVRGTIFRNTTPPTSVPPIWKRAKSINGIAPICGNDECRCWVCEILIGSTTTSIPSRLIESISSTLGTNWIARYLSCPACPWISPSIAVQQEEINA